MCAVQQKKGVIYFIKNKDTTLGSFLWKTPNKALLLKNDGLPFFIFNDLQSWIQSRTPPKNRTFIRELLSWMQLRTLSEIIDYSKGLTLTDTLWVTNDSSLKWNDVNLFRNSFDEVIAKAVFDGVMSEGQPSMLSPEFSTNGMLQKRWLKRDDGVYLLKGGLTGGYNTGHEPCAEVMASQVLDRLGYDHVQYTMGTRLRTVLAKSGESTTERYEISCCELATSEQTMLLPIHMYADFHDFSELLGEVERLGVREMFAQTLLFDYLSLNMDRHAGNIGVYLDADTFEFKSLFPIFDNGHGMLSQWMPDMSYSYYENPRLPALYDSFEEGARYAKEVLGNGHNVESLLDFEFDRSQILLETDERLDGIEKWFHERVRKFLKM